MHKHEKGCEHLTCCLQHSFGTINGQLVHARSCPWAIDFNANLPGKLSLMHLFAQGLCMCVGSLAWIIAHAFGLGQVVAGIRDHLYADSQKCLIGTNEPVMLQLYVTHAAIELQSWPISCSFGGALGNTASLAGACTHLSCMLMAK